MTVDPARLLQMLEPTVRPGNASATSGVQQGKPAFENRAFDDLLNEAKQSESAATKTGETTSPMRADPLGFLGGLGQIENAALRNVLAQARESETDSVKTA